MSLVGSCSSLFFSFYHSFIYVSIKFELNFNTDVVYFRDYGRLNYNEITHYVDQFDISRIYYTNNVDMQLSVLNNLIEGVHNLVPFSPARSNPISNNWIYSSEITKARSLRDAAFKEYFANPTDETWKSFCKLRNKAKSVLRKHHRKYGDRLFTGVNNCYLWSRVSKLVCVGNIL